MLLEFILSYLQSDRVLIIHIVISVTDCFHHDILLYFFHNFKSPASTESGPGLRKESSTPNFIFAQRIYFRNCKLNVKHTHSNTVFVFFWFSPGPSTQYPNSNIQEL